jgi:predicted MFS family arabinose efflux permease
VAEPSSTYRNEWQRGWPTLIAAALAGGASTVHFFTTGLMIGPITKSMGWSVAQVTLGLMICSVAVIPGAPLVGWLVDRLGQRRVVLTGLPLFFLSFAATGPLASSYAGWVTAWCIMALVSTLTKGNVWTMWVAREFDAARGMALALLMSGTGLFAIFLPFLTQTAIDALGWRNAYAALGAAMFLLAYPVAWIVLRSPRYDRPLTSVRRQASEDAAAGGMTAREAFRTAAFWQLVTASLLAGWGIMSVQVFIAPMLVEKAFAAKTAAAFAGVLGAAAIIGRLTTGLLLDRFPARIVGTVSMLLPALACVIYLYVSPSWSMAALVAALFGLAMGAEGDVIAYLASRHFGLGNFGAIFGFMAGAVGAGAGAGPFTFGLIRDHTGSYATVAAAICVVMLITALLIGTLRGYPQERVPGEGMLEARGDALT